tara:strand:+ start:500 stop:1057 length:558 start_codon:yes stop_codon:yes gene_type:complete
MSINYTVTEVTKEFVKVKYQDDREVIIPVKTWVDKAWIEANIQQMYNEPDEGSVDDIPLKVGDTGTIKTIQEGEKEFKEFSAKQKELENSYTFDYKLMRRMGYPFINDSIGALVKAVLTGDKTELEAINTVIEDMKTKYPKDDKKYTKAELIEEKKNSPCKSHFPDGYIGGSGEVPWFVQVATTL